MGFIPYGFLNQTIIRRRPVQTVTNQGDLIPASYDDQPIQAMCQQYNRKSSGGENIDDQGIVTKRVWNIYMNLFTDSTLQTKTDVVPTDRLVISDINGTYECRVENLHLGAGVQHHIECTAVFLGPTGD